MPIIKPVDETDFNALREELAALEAEEAQVSAERRRLHEQIDRFSGSESSRAREREISDRRRELHRRIDALRELLDLERAGRTGAVVRELAPESEPERPHYATSG